MASRKIALTSFALISALAFTGCGSSSTSNSSDSSASASATQAPVDGIQTLTDNYTTAMTDVTEVRTALAGSDSATVATFSKITSNLDTSSGSTLQVVIDAVTSLTSDEKAQLKTALHNDANKLPGMTDYSDMTDDEQLSLDFINLLLMSNISQNDVKATADNNTVDTSTLTIDGDTTKVPMKAIADAETYEGLKQFFGEVPAVYVDGAWKLEGKQYLEALKATSLD